MKILIYFSILLSLILIFTNCTQHSSANILIVPFEMINQTDTMTDRGKTLYYKSENYLIKNYVESKKTENIIDSFVAENKNKSYQKYEGYNINFYRESSKTNIEHITENPRDLVRYSQSHDLLFDYSWSKGKFVARYKYKNGEMVPKSDIIVGDVTDSIQ